MRGHPECFTSSDPRGPYPAHPHLRLLAHLPASRTHKASTRPKNLPLQTFRVPGWGERARRAAPWPSRPGVGELTPPAPIGPGVLPTECLFHRSAPGRRASRGGGGAALQPSSLPSPPQPDASEEGQEPFWELSPPSPPRLSWDSGNKTYEGTTTSPQGQTAKATLGCPVAGK